MLLTKSEVKKNKVAHRGKQKKQASVKNDSKYGLKNNEFKKISINFANIKSLTTVIPLNNAYENVPVNIFICLVWLGREI